MRKLFFVIILFVPAFCFAQTTNKNAPVSEKPNVQAIKSSPAYAEVLLKKTELTAELENLLVEFTEDYPKVKELRFTLTLLQKDVEKLLAVTDASKLTLALGKLMVRRAELAAEVWNLQRQYADEHPDVKRAKRKVDVFEQAVKEILP